MKVQFIKTNGSKIVTVENSILALEIYNFVGNSKPLYKPKIRIKNYQKSYPTKDELKLYF